jgi:hypothetical protein
VDLLEQLADVGLSDTTLRGLNDHATIGSEPTRQSDALDSELLQVGLRGMCRGITLAHRSSCPLLSEEGRVTVRG